jgi:pyruvate-ferredoxin/flavodoxin oxidoreductase
VQSGHWPLFRYNPALTGQGKNPFQLDSRTPTLTLDKYIYNETRYSMLRHSQPEAAKRLFESAQKNVNTRWKLYEYLASQPGDTGGNEAEGEDKLAPASTKEEKK